MEKQKVDAVFAVFILIIIICLVGLFLAIPKYRVYSKTHTGIAMLRQAENERKVQIEQARGELEASKMRAEAIEIIGKAAKEYPEYREQEFMGAFAEALNNDNIHQIIYVPTEANIPILEATRNIIE